MPCPRPQRFAQARPATRGCLLQYHLSFRATSGSKRKGGVAVVSPAPSLTTCSAPLARRGQPDGFSAGSEALDSTPSSLRLRLLALVVSPPLKGEAEMGFAPKSATPISRPVTQASWAAAPTASGPEPSSAGGCSPRIWRSLAGGDSSLPPRLSEIGFCSEICHTHQQAGNAGLMGGGTDGVRAGTIVRRGVLPPHLAVPFGWGFIASPIFPVRWFGVQATRSEALAYACVANGPFP